MAEISIAKRLFIYHKTLSIIEEYFVHWEAVPRLDARGLFHDCLERVLHTGDRNEFAFLMKEMICQLKNGHSWYADRRFYKKLAMPMGFYAFYHDRERKWVVSVSVDKRIKLGDVITKIDGKDTSEFFKGMSKYIEASSDRQAKNRLFLKPWLFPATFKITDQAGRSLLIRRRKSLELPDQKRVEAKMLGDTVGYVKIPNFSDKSYADSAISHIRKFKDCKSIIIDVRDNYGGATPLKLFGVLMNRKYRRFRYDMIKPLNALKAMYGEKIKHNIIHINSNYRKGGKNAYKGRLIILVNQATASAAEDFVGPFKDNRRARLMGIKTSGCSGDPFFYDFGDGISVAIGALRAYLPNGSDFEGIGIRPDKEIYPSIQDIKKGRDVILEKALRLAGS
jgi:carboxyl-terminal processing protease